jgi:hypothetical protein
MHDFIVFVGGAVFAAALIYFFATLDALDRRMERRREYRRPGYISFHFAQSNTEGRNASADPNADELSGGGGVPPSPPYLRLVRDGGSSELVIPLDDDGA